MRVVIATPLYPPEIGGPATYAKLLEEEWKSAGIEVRVVRYGRIERALPAGARHLAYLLRLLPALRGAEVIFALDTWSVGLPALAAARLTGLRLVLRIGGDFLWESYVARTGEGVRLSDFYQAPRRFSLKERIIKRQTKRLLARADAIAFNSAWQLAIWREAYGFDAAKARVVENAFPAERGDTPARGHVFVSAGRDHPLKNSARLARAFARVREAHPGIELDTRALPPAEHRARVAAAYAVIVASLSEVNPNTVIDAIAAGKPFIAPRDSGAYERLHDLGLWVDARDERALEDALSTLLDPARYEAMRARIRAFAYARSRTAVAEELLALCRP